jgi:hypothetical protein
MAKGRQRGNREIKKPKAAKKLAVSNTSSTALRDQIHVRITPPGGTQVRPRAADYHRGLASGLSHKALSGDTCVYVP